MPRVPNRGEFLKPFEGDKLAAGGEEVTLNEEKLKNRLEGADRGEIEAAVQETLD